jgi:hypothetical protein
MDHSFRRFVVSLATRVRALQAPDMSAATGPSSAAHEDGRHDGRGAVSCQESPDAVRRAYKVAYDLRTASLVQPAALKASGARDYRERGGMFWFGLRRTALQARAASNAWPSGASSRRVRCTMG